MTHKIILWNLRVSWLDSAPTAADLLTFLVSWPAGDHRVTGANIDYSCASATNKTSEQNEPTGSDAGTWQSFVCVTTQRLGQNGLRMSQKSARR